MTEGNEVILRRWSARIRTADERAYADYILATGLDDYRATPGNLGYQMLFRALGDGTSEVTTLSWWTSLAAIEAFAGADPTLARYYPEDDRFLLDRPERVEHHRVAAGSDVVTLAGG
ncbi:antibiotic biosynthesis monooxygenase [Sphingomonas cannabina]|uniref:antibiotic biosynthesis monooxygenase n=1 Tax=Sphingomonas cannabina TaxID=2899123 RepID=UPI001F1F0129|nr:antibiotic biosynthesis monooxygenase [Sphingomonas cannabina]UIJ45086.1 antibiotic biosynthesis monooxygenase [Sphingomonas cannabina]